MMANKNLGWLVLLALLFQNYQALAEEGVDSKPFIIIKAACQQPYEVVEKSLLPRSSDFRIYNMQNRSFKMSDPQAGKGDSPDQYWELKDPQTLKDLGLARLSLTFEKGRLSQLWFRVDNPEADTFDLEYEGNLKRTALKRSDIYNGKKGYTHTRSDSGDLMTVMNQGTYILCYEWERS